MGTGECGNEVLGSIKCGEFLDQLRTGQLLKKDSAPWSHSMQCISVPTIVKLLLLSSGEGEPSKCLPTELPDVTEMEQHTDRRSKPQSLHVIVSQLNM